MEYAFLLKNPAVFAAEPVAVSYAPSAAQKWSDDEIERLVELIENGAHLDVLASRLGRSEREVREYGSYLGLLLPEHSPKASRNHERSPVGSCPFPPAALLTARSGG